MKSFTRSIPGLNRLVGGEGLRSELIRNGAGSLILKAASVLLTFLTTVVMARALGADNYGVYSYVYALVSLLSIPAEFGLPNLLVRETAKALARQEWGKIKGIWNWAGRVTAILTVTIVLGAGVAFLIWGNHFSRVQLVTMTWGLALVPLIALGALRGAALRGLHKVMLGQLPEQAFLPGFYILLILGTIFIFQEKKLSPDRAMGLQVAAAALAFIIGAWLLWRATPGEVHRAKPIFEGRLWLASTLPLAFIGGMQLINRRTSILILGLFENSAQVGVFRVADQVSLLVSLGLQAINIVVAPQFARLYAVGDKERLQRLAAASARVVLLLTLAATAVFLFAGKPLLRMIFGAEFIGAFWPLSILSIGQLINSVTGSVGVLLNMTGHEQETAKGMTISAISNVVLNLVLIPPFGVSGAALASAITMTIWNILLWFAVRRRLNINSMAFNFSKIKS